MSIIALITFLVCVTERYTTGFLISSFEITGNLYLSSPSSFLKLYSADWQALSYCFPSSKKGNILFNALYDKCPNFAKVTFVSSSITLSSIPNSDNALIISTSVLFRVNTSAILSIFSCSFIQSSSKIFRASAFSKAVLIS